MTISQRRTKHSLQFLAVDEKDKQKIKDAVQKLSPTHQFKLVEEHYFVAVEFYLDLNLVTEERVREIKEILEAVGL